MTEAVGSESKALIQKQINFVQSTSYQRQAQATARAESKALLSEWSKISDDITQSLTNAITNGMQNGKSAIHSFFDYLKNTAKTTVIKVAMQPVQTH